MMRVIGKNRFETKPDTQSLEEFGTVEALKQVKMNRGRGFFFRFQSYVGYGETKLSFVVIILFFLNLCGKREQSENERCETENQ